MGEQLPLALDERIVCSLCGRERPYGYAPGWVTWVDGGRAMCPPCNERDRKEWQEEREKHD